MTEKLTLKKLSGELDELRGRVSALEQQLEQKIEAVLGVIAASKAAMGEVAGAHETPPVIDVERHQQMIAETAYLIAEQRGFAEGDPLQDWIEAERRVNERLMQQGAPAPAAKTAGARKPAKAAAAGKRGTRKKPAAKTPRAVK